tara:strand:+ start:710 stop:913 length:204 start_codon:yes stop_codon:yes gene_type:complete
MGAGNPKLILAAQSLGFDKKEAKLFVDVMGRFAQLEMPFFEAVETAIVLIGTESRHIYIRNRDKKKK